MNLLAAGREQTGNKPGSDVGIMGATLWFAGQVFTVELTSTIEFCPNPRASLLIMLMSFISGFLLV